MHYLLATLGDILRLKEIRRGEDTKKKLSRASRGRSKLTPRRQSAKSQISKLISRVALALNPATVLFKMLCVITKAKPSVRPRMGRLKTMKLMR